MKDLTRSQAIVLFETLDDAGFDVAISARTIDKMHPPKTYPARVTVRPCTREQLERLTDITETLGLDYKADSLSPNFGGGVTFVLFTKGARSYPV